jgi:hypothetical protein
VVILIILVFCLSVFCFIYLRSVLCFRCCQFLSIVHSFFLTFICMLRLSFLTCSILLPNVHLFHFFLNISVNGRILWMISSTTVLGSEQIHIKLFKNRNCSNALQSINGRHYILECILYKYMYNFRVVLNYETKSKRNERNEAKRNEILRNATKYTKMRNETQRNETKFTIMLFQCLFKQITCLKYY